MLAHYYRFGPYVVDTAKRAIWKDGIRLRITRTPFDMLLFFLERHDRTVSKDELIAGVWPDAVIEENTLSRHISALRKVFHDTRDVADYIATVHGVGYRFTAEVEELDTLLREEQPRAVDVPAPSELVARSRLPLPVAAWWRTTVIGSLLAAAVLVLLVLTQLRDDTQARTEARVLEPFTHGGFDSQPTWAPDGLSLAFASDSAGAADIWVKRFDQPDAQRVTTSEAPDWQPDWSPDGRFLTFRSEREGGGIFLIEPNGRGERRLASFGYRPQWSRESDRILFSETEAPFTRTLRLFIVSVDGGSPRPVLGQLTSGFKQGFVRWHPAGQTRVSIWGRDRSGAWRFVTSPVDGGALVESHIDSDVGARLRSGALKLGRFVWSRSGSHLYFEGASGDVHNIFRVTIEPTTQAWIGEPEPVTHGPGQDVDIALAPDDSTLAFSVRASATRLWTFDVATARSGHQLDSGRVLTHPDVEPRTFDVMADGSRMIYKTVRGNWQELWVGPPGTAEERLLRSTDWTTAYPRLSNDGTKLAYVRAAVSKQDGQQGNVLAVYDLSRKSERVVASAGRPPIPKDWTNDGRWILSDCGGSICLVDGTSSSGGPPVVRVVLSDPALHLAPQRFSPDQRWIAFNVVERERYDASMLAVIPADGRRPWIELTDRESRKGKLIWSTDGRIVFYIANRTGIYNVWARRFDPEGGRALGTEFRVTAFQSARRMVLSDLSTSEIGIANEKLLVPVTDSTSRIWTLRRTP